MSRGFCQAQAKLPQPLQALTRAATLALNLLTLLLRGLQLLCNHGLRLCPHLVDTLPPLCLPVMQPLLPPPSPYLAPFATSLQAQSLPLLATCRQWQRRTYIVNSNYLCFRQTSLRSEVIVIC